MYVDDENMNCCFNSGDGKFNYRVCAIIIEDGCVLLATNDGADYYYLVGGRVHLGETAYNAVLREVKEETGVDYDVDRLAFINENFFISSGDANNGKKIHELALFFVMKPRGEKKTFADNLCSVGIERFEWVPMNKLKDLRVFPTFLASRIDDLPMYAESIVTDETQE